MKSIVIIPNPKKDIGLSVTESVVRKLTELNMSAFLDSHFADRNIPSAKYYEDFPEDAELIIVIGGDGSVIDASSYAVGMDIPILGVNLGKVGYLSEVEPDSLSQLDRLVGGDYFVEEKLLLSVECSNGGHKHRSERLAVNDVVISQGGLLGIADFKVENSLGDCVNYRADGIILSTPQGSTAYSLSAGGPIISHDLDSIIVSPVCPHSFFNRSRVFSSGERLKVTNVGESDLNISVDGRYFSLLKKYDECTVLASERKMKMITFARNNMFSTLFRKMRILEDIK